jgi:hypothetical protein
LDEYQPRTSLQKLITYTSKFHSKAPKFKSVDIITGALQRYGQDKVQKFFELQSLFGIPNLEPLEDRYEEWHRWFKYQLEQLQQQPSASLLNEAGIAK